MRLTWGARWSRRQRRRQRSIMVETIEGGGGSETLVARAVAGRSGAVV
jgi:hypothetical protein